MPSLISSLIFGAISLTAHCAPTTSLPPSFVYAGDAPYGARTTALSSILTCPYGNPDANSKPVLLVHGTGSTGNESWGQGYVPALQAGGYTPCYVTLPNRSMDDMQTTAAYVAYNMHYLSYLAGGSLISVISHSQGGPNCQWALRFFPSTRNVTERFIPLAPDFIGADEFTASCNIAGAVGACQASLWQQAMGSNYMAAQDYMGHQALVETSPIWSEVDGLIIPPQDNALLPGAFVNSVQALCPARPVTHFQFLNDAAVFAMAVDALEHRHTVLSRVSTSVCTMVTAEGMDVTIPGTVNATYQDVVTGVILTGPRLTAEPPIKNYAMIDNQT